MVETIRLGVYDPLFPRIQGPEDVNSSGVV